MLTIQFIFQTGKCFQFFQGKEKLSKYNVERVL